MFIDALFGVGIRLPLPAQVIELIHWVNEQQAYRIAIDIPTGVQSDHGEVQAAFHADLTLCLHGFKPSAFLEGSIDYYGEKQSSFYWVGSERKMETLAERRCESDISYGERLILTKVHLEQVY